MAGGDRMKAASAAKLTYDDFVHFPDQVTRAARSPKVTDAFKSFVLDRLEDLGEVTPRAMFGAIGLYRRGVFFGIVAGDVLYLKVDDVTRPAFERASMAAFKPYPDRPGTMQYYAVPTNVLESATDLVEWARRAVAVAERSGQPGRAREAAIGSNPRRRGEREP
jgi:DNA transformation protein